MTVLDDTRLRLVDDALDDLHVKSSVERTEGRLYGVQALGGMLDVELKVRRVRTEAGSRRYGLPIGAPITADARRRAKANRRASRGGSNDGGVAPAPVRGGGGSTGRSGGGKRGSSGGGRRRGGRGGGGGNGGGGGPGGGGPGGALGGLAGLAGLLAGLLGDKGPKGKKPKKPRKPRKGKKGGKGGGKGNGGKGSGGKGGSGKNGSGKGSGNGSGGDGGQAGNGQYGGGGGGSGLNNPVSRGNADYIGRKTLASVVATRERLDEAVKSGDWDIEVKVDPRTRLYFFGGPGGERNTGIAATSAADARKRKRRGGDRVVAVHKPNAQERAAMDRGEWVRTRRDGKTPDQSRYGKGRGQGPPRKSS